MARRFILPALLALACLSTASADEKLKDIACRSVHLRYTAEKSLAFYNEVTVRKSAPGTYFCVCGWDRGYFGIQELGDGRKLVLFSVWDSGQDDPKAVAEEKRVKLLYQDEKVRIGRFGGEGTGGQCFFDYDWKVGDTCRLMVSARVDGQRTEYAGWIYLPADKVWKHLVTFSTITGGRELGGYYSFIEDFKRDRVSATKIRQAEFGNGWVRAAEDWQPIVKAQFTADSNPAVNIDSTVSDDRFALATGGETENAHTKLNGALTLPERNRTVPDDLPKLP